MPRPSSTSLPPEARSSGSPRPTPTPEGEPRPLPQSAAPKIVAAVALALIAGLAFAVFIAPDDPPAVVEPPTPVVPPPLAVRPDPAPLPPVVEPPPAILSVAFGSTPEGAEVRAGDAVLCVTPCIHDLKETIDVTFHRDGYLDQTRTVRPEDEAVEVRLVPRRRPTGGETTVPGLKTKL